MRTVLKLEEAGMLLLSVYLFSLLNFDWWWYLALFLAPDIGMLGYIINTKTGAFTYNILHHKGIAILVYVLGIYTGSELLQLIGLIMFGHAAFDRVLGYGLKYSDSFKHTHLGIIGNTNDTDINR